MSFTFIPACGEDQLDLFASPGRPSATLAYNLDRPFPAPRFPLRGGYMILGGRIRSARAAETANECRRRGISTVVFGFSPCPGLELLRFCEVLRRRGIRCVITEQLWQEGCGAAMLLSTAISGGTLRQRMEEATKATAVYCVVKFWLIFCFTCQIQQFPTIPILSFSSSLASAGVSPLAEAFLMFELSITADNLASALVPNASVYFCLIVFPPNEEVLAIITP